ncbi:hypothetical protein FQ087_15205 [Sporosarcina sp. ANT_H38]|uniref:hypothetical protein n=1 Tax=Sporosarcina sp. ANT_H38 TaxID=2597358 RepID=UPI0011F2FD2E|nr:hypothetical protein [Sporosarcina sp. ANT_H38]KAA0955922.1 hypothetical protein FQ087_15205 [Sporosarcina sp. ANT_H38]
MKKYMIFIISFTVLYTVFQLSSGAILTALYKPDLSSVHSISAQEVVFAGTSTIPLLFIFLSSTIAYFISQKLGRTSKAPDELVNS